MLQLPASVTDAPDDPGGAWRSALPRLSDVLLRQEGVVHRQQLLARGWSDDRVRHAARSRWRVLHPGVYATHLGPVTWTARVHAGLLHGGPGAAAGGLTAAHLLGLHDDQPGVVHVLLPGDRRQEPAVGLRLERRRRLASLCDADRSPRVLRVEEVVLDLASASRASTDVMRWVSQACQRRLTTPDALAEALARRLKVRHRQLLLEVLDVVDDGAESPLEVRYVRDVERPHGLPAGRRNRVEGARSRCDVVLAEYRLRVELDGKRYHRGRDDADVSRDLDALVRGGEVTVRLGWASVASTPCRTAVALGVLLRQRGWAGEPQPCRDPACAVRCAVR